MPVCATLIDSIWRYITLTLYYIDIILRYIFIAQILQTGACPACVEQVQHRTGAEDVETEFWAGKVVSRGGFGAFQCRQEGLDCFKGRSKHGGTERSVCCFNAENAFVFFSQCSKCSRSNLYVETCSLEEGNYLWSGRPYIFSCCGLFFFFLLFFSSPNLSRRRLYVCHTSTPCEFRMQVWNLLQAARWKHRTQKSRQKSPSRRHRTTLSGYIFATKAHIDNRKKNLLSSNMSSTCPHNNGERRPTSGWDRFRSLGHPCKFQLVSRLGSVTARHLVVGVSQTLRRWTEGATYI